MTPEDTLPVELDAVPPSGTARAVEAPTPVAEIDGLRFAWPRSATVVLDVPHLRLEAGRTVFLHGPSGTGKSTLLGVLAGVLVPQAGDCRVLGQRWSALAGARRDAFRADHVGVLFQQFNLLPYLSVIDNVLLPCRFSPRRAQRAAASAGAPGSSARDAVRRCAESLLKQMGLARVDWSRPAVELSVGQQQRVAAARALIGGPELVLADEPTSALDAARRDQFMDLLLGQCRAAGSTLVFVSHDERLAGRFDQRLALGEVNRAGSAEEART
ncbi:MAG: ABC transporter ATP-binding protein [Ideonella sp.]|jgi:putative ABC transport system ATP-binding protein|nr:ABC transporter ATP-binding protein [Ideonella sp.]